MLTFAPCRSRAVRAGCPHRSAAYRTCPRRRAACPEGIQPGPCRTHLKRTVAPQASVVWSSAARSSTTHRSPMETARRPPRSSRCTSTHQPRTCSAPLRPRASHPPRLHPLCTRSAPALHPLCTRSARALHALCTHSAPTLHSPCVRSALAPYPPRFPLPGAGSSGCDAQQHVPPRPGLRRRARPHRCSLDARRVRPRQPSRRQRRLVKVPALSAAPGPRPSHVSGHPRARVYPLGPDRSPRAARMPARGCAGALVAAHRRRFHYR